MKTEKGRRDIRRAVERTSDRARGVIPAYVGLAAMRMAEIHIADVSKLPVEEGTVNLQNGSGQDLFMIGYSVVGGGDVVA